MHRPGQPVRIVIADDHQMFRDGLRYLLEVEPGFVVVTEAADGLEAIQAVRRSEPDVLLLDVAMPRMGGLEMLANLKGSTTRIVLLTAEIDPADLLRSMQLGARGVVLKESASRLLINGIHEVMSGRFLIGAGVADNLLEAVQQLAAPSTPKYGLTSRELEVIAAIVAGQSNRVIADRLAISQQTVKHHLSKVFEKTGVASRLELAIFAIKHNLVLPGAGPPDSQVQKRDPES